MSNVWDDKYAYKESDYFKKRPEFSDLGPFYVTVSICTIFFVFLIALNIVLGCCSRYSEYWNDRHTGNRWIISLWTSTPHNQPSLDYTELEAVHIPQHHKVYLPEPEVEIYEHAEIIPDSPPAQIKQPPEYFELQQKRESAI